MGKRQLSGVRDLGSCFWFFAGFVATWISPPPATFALFTAQEGQTDPSAKSLKGFGGASVLEIVASDGGNAWRAVYTVRFQDAVYVLHVFQKKSTKGIATPAREMNLIRQRLAEAERDHRERQN